jgi:hypothetical protein
MGEFSERLTKGLKGLVCPLNPQSPFRFLYRAQAIARASTTPPKATPTQKYHRDSIDAGMVGYVVLWLDIDFVEEVVKIGSEIVVEDVRVDSVLAFLLEVDVKVVTVLKVFVVVSMVVTVKIGVVVAVVLIVGEVVVAVVLIAGEVVVAVVLIAGEVVVVVLLIAGEVVARDVVDVPFIAGTMRNV